MKILRWLAFLPVGGFLIAVAQLLVGLIAERLSFWIGGPLILFFGGLVAAAAIIPCRIAPDPKIGAAILLTLFLLFEVFALISFLPRASMFPAVARLYVDVVVVVGGFIGGSPTSKDAS